MWGPSMLNDLDTHIIYMIKKFYCYDNFFPEIARPFIFNNVHSAYRAFCTLLKIKFVTDLWKILS